MRKGKDMKRTLMTICAVCCLAVAQAQTVSPQQQAAILNLLDDAVGVLNNVVSGDMEVHDFERLYGGGYFIYNGKDWKSFSQWYEGYYKQQLSDRIPNHTVTVNRPSISDLSPSNSLVGLKAILTREAADYVDGHPIYKVKEENVGMTVMLDERTGGLQILELTGNWAFSPVLPTPTSQYSLELDNGQMTVDARGGKYTFGVLSHRYDHLTYGDMETVRTGGPHEEEYKVETMLSTGITGKKTRTGTLQELRENKVNEYHQHYVNIPTNHRRKTRYHQVKVIQPESGLNRTLYITQKKGGGIDENYLPDYEVNLHYGITGSVGLSAMTRLSDTQFAVGVYGMMDFNRIYQLCNPRDLQISGSYHSTVTTADYKVTTTHTKPHKRGYSAIADPDGEAEYRRAVTYVMGQAGFCPAQFLRLDLGLGAARVQHTYKMKDAYEVTVTEYTPLRDGVPAKETEYAYERSGHELLYKDLPKWRFAARTGATVQIPLGDMYLNIGAGYTIVCGAPNADNLDITAGLAWEF